jgi:hypothetical protein
MTTKTIYKRKWKKEIKERHVLYVVAELEHIQGNKKPHFSITADYYICGQHDSFGCLHDFILKNFTDPGVKLLVDLHLSDDDGVPMYAVENGWYHYGGTMWEKRNNKFLAKHLRIPLEEAEKLSFNSKEEFAEYVEKQKPRWKEEAEKAFAFLKEKE